MRVLRDWRSGLSGAAVALAMACAVFPEQATLPGAVTGDSGLAGAPEEDGAAGEPSEPSAGEPSVTPGGRAAAGGGEPALGGSGGRAGAPTAGGGGAESAAGRGGIGGSGAQPCPEPKTYVASTTLDVWIGALDDKGKHGTEATLSVNGGSDEQRTLFAVTVPAAPPGAVLLSADVVLQLLSNADVGLAARRLGLFLLQPRAVVESEATWRRFAQNGKWDAAGGDLGERISEAVVPAGTENGLVRFDVTEAVRSVLGAQASAYGLAVLELGTPPGAPSALSFTSREGNAGQSPSLLLSYCE